MKLIRKPLTVFLLISSVLLLSACVSRKAPNPLAVITPQVIVGGDRDAQGCIPSAGYSWCAAERQCVRQWEVADARGFQNTPQAFMAYCAGAYGAVATGTVATGPVAAGTVTYGTVAQQTAQQIAQQVAQQPIYQAAPVARSSVANGVRNTTTRTVTNTTARAVVPTRTAPIVGAKVDSHGCIPSAGYSWCASQNECVRPWELARANGLPNNQRTFNAFCSAKPTLGTGSSNSAVMSQTPPSQVQSQVLDSGVTATPPTASVHTRPFKADAHGCTTSTGPWCDSEQQCITSNDLAEIRGIPNNKTAFKKWCSNSNYSETLTPTTKSSGKLASSKGGSGMVGSDMQQTDHAAVSNQAAYDTSAFANACNEEAGYAWCAREQQCLRSEVLAKSRRIANTRQAFNQYCSR